MIDFEKLPADDDRAFVVLEAAFRQEMHSAASGAAQAHRHMSPAYSYFNKVAAAADTLGIDPAIAGFEMPDPGKAEFSAAFARFLHLVERRVVEIRITAGRGRPAARRRGWLSRLSGTP